MRVSALQTMSGEEPLFDVRYSEFVKRAYCIFLATRTRARIASDDSLTLSPLSFVNIDAVEQWTRDPLLILGNDSRSTHTGFLWVVPITVWAGIHIIGHGIRVLLRAIS